MKRIYRNQYGPHPDAPAFAHISRVQSEKEMFDMDTSAPSGNSSPTIGQAEKPVVTPTKPPSAQRSQEGGEGR